MANQEPIIEIKINIFYELQILITMIKRFQRPIIHWVNQLFYLANLVDKKLLFAHIKYCKKIAFLGKFEKHLFWTFENILSYFKNLVVFFMEEFQYKGVFVQRQIFVRLLEFHLLVGKELNFLFSVIWHHILY